MTMLSILVIELGCDININFKSIKELKAQFLMQSYIKSFDNLIDRLAVKNVEEMSDALWIKAPLEMMNDMTEAFEFNVVWH